MMRQGAAMRVWAILAGVAERQHLVLAPWQLTALGVAHVTIGRHVAAHGWERDELGMIWLPGEDTPMRRTAAAFLALSKPTDAWERLDVRDWDDEAAVIAALVSGARDCGVVVCGPTAAWLHDLRDDPDDRVWLLLGAHDARTKRGGIRLRYGNTPADGVQEIAGLPVLSPEHTIIDNARVPADSYLYRYYRLVNLLQRADRLRVTTIAKVAAVVDDAGKFRGKTLLQEVLRNLEEQMVHSGAEAKARELVGEVLAEFGLALHPRPLEIFLNGVRVGEADLAVVELRYDIEVDGPHHDSPEQQAKDRNRDRNVRDAEWTVERFPTELIELDPRTFQAQVRQTVRRLLRHRARNTDTP